MAYETLFPCFYLSHKRAFSKLFESRCFAHSSFELFDNAVKENTAVTYTIFRVAPAQTISVLNADRFYTRAKTLKPVAD